MFEFVSLFEFEMWYEIKNLIFMFVLYTLSNNLCFWVSKSSLCVTWVWVCVSMSVLFFCCRFLYIEIWLSPGATFIESQLFYSVWRSPATHLFSPIPEGLNTLKPRLWLFTLRLAFLWELSSQNTKKVAN